MISRVKIYIGIGLTTLLIAAWYHVDANPHDYSAVKGVIDLRGHRFEKDGFVDLSGEWELYWMRLLDPDQFKDTTIKPDLYSYVPRSWTREKLNGRSLPVYGYATYRLRVIVDKDYQTPHFNSDLYRHRHFSIKLNDIHSAYRLWVNNELMLEAGVVSTTEDSFVARWSHENLQIHADSDTTEVVIQIANFFDRQLAGIDEPIQLGLRDDIVRTFRINLALYLVCFGILFIMGIYHLMLYFVRSRERLNLYFSMMCILFAFQSLFVGDRSILLIFPSLSVELYCRSWFLTYNIFAIFTVFFRELFPDEYKKLYTRLVVGFYALVTVGVMIVPVPVFLGHIIYVDIISFVIMVTDVALVILAVKRKRQFALLVLIGVSLPFILGINDLLFAMDIIITGYYAPLGYIGYVVCQSIYISQRDAETFRRVEVLSRQLEQSNVELEAKVEQRTQEIMLANAQLKQLNMTKDKFLTIMAHDLKSPLNAAMGFSELLAMEYDDLDDDERKAYSRNILAASSNTFKLLENLLDWSRLQMGRSDFSPVLHDVSASINEALLLHSSQAEEKHIFLRSDVPYGTFVYADEHMIKTILRNLVSNALKFTDTGGLVRISKAVGENEQPSTVTLMVQDTGVGMSTIDMASLFHIDTKLRKPGTANEQGTGLGLLICKEYMEKNGGSIRVESSLGIGTTFYVVIPSVAPLA